MTTPSSNFCTGSVTFNGVDDQVTCLGTNAGVPGRIDTTQVGWKLQLEYNYKPTAGGHIFSEGFFEWEPVAGGFTLRPISCSVDWTDEVMLWGLRGTGSIEDNDGNQRAIWWPDGHLQINANGNNAYFYMNGNNVPILKANRGDGEAVTLFQISSGVATDEAYLDVDQRLNRWRIASSGGLYLGLGVASTKALFEVDSTTKGVLDPRMTTTQQDAIASPTTGLRLYNTSQNIHKWYDGTAWRGQMADIGALVDNIGGTLSDTLAALPNPADAPLTADALRDDLVANLIPAIRDALSSIADAVNDLRTELRTHHYMA